jgi:hypothetical protein
MTDIGAEAAAQRFTALFRQSYAARRTDRDRAGGRPGCFDRPPDQPTDPVTFRAGLEPAARPFAPDTSEVVARTTLSRITRIFLIYPHRAPYPLSFTRSTGWGLGIAPPSVAHLTGKVVGYNAQGRVVATYRVLPIAGRG